MESAVFHPNWHCAEQVSHSNTRAMVESEDPLLGRAWNVSGQDLGVVDAHRIVRVVLSVMGCHGEQ